MVSGEVQARLVAETPDCIAIRDIDPQAPVHVLIIPRAHVASLDALSDAGLAGRILLFAADVARREGIAETGYRTVVNTGADGGQTVDHLHVHVLGGRHMRWPPG